MIRDRHGKFKRTWVPKFCEKFRGLSRLGLSIEFLLTSHIINIVLVHGILGFREKFGIEYFRGTSPNIFAKKVSR